ncbi:hypothetical protein [Sporolactobacillus sp. KGMB 08714]|uniref:hypothetical protein n=1 Tax=Sporolactobacillus sp. KGMB 08714 TaxID=3064704 RepID=UPI002FBDA4C0
MMTIFTKFITLRNGKRIFASQYGLEAFCIEVSEEKHQEYLEKQRKKKEKTDAEKKKNVKKNMNLKINRNKKSKKNS